MENTCSDCGKPNLFLIKVVDRDGATQYCGLCMFGLVASHGRVMTVFLDVQPSALLQN